MLLSIVIPTKNRQKYCISSVKQILSLNLDNTQIVIQDNSDDNRLEKEFASYIQNGSIKYHYRKGIVSFVDNFSEAISICDGEYVCMIGDDDGILPNIIEITKSAKMRDIDCVIAGLNIGYIWPSNKAIVKNGENGFLCVAYVKNKEISVNPQKGLEQLALTAGQNYQNLDLPRVYHGVVKRTKLDEIKKIAGNYFKGLTPDIFIAVALACVCHKVSKLYYPITISGICPLSGSADSATGRHTGELKEAPHFRGHDEYHWDQKAPAIYSVESIWAETALQAFHIFEREDLYKKFNVKKLDQLCMQKYPQFREIIIKHASQFDINLSNYKPCTRFHAFCKISKKIYSRVKNLPAGVRKYYNVLDIKEAEKIVGKLLALLFIVNI